MYPLFWLDLFMPTSVPVAAAAMSKGANASASSTKSWASTIPQPSPRQKPITCLLTWILSNRVTQQDLLASLKWSTPTTPTCTALVAAMIANTAPATIVRITSIAARSRSMKLIGRRYVWRSTSIGGGMVGSCQGSSMGCGDPLKMIDHWWKRILACNELWSQGLG